MSVFHLIFGTTYGILFQLCILSLCIIAGVMLYHAFCNNNRGNENYVVENNTVKIDQVPVYADKPVFCTSNQAENYGQNVLLVFPQNNNQLYSVYSPESQNQHHTDALEQVTV